MAWLLLLFIAVPSDYKSEIQTIGETDSGTAEGRLFAWTTGLRMWMDHPILGVGPGSDDEARRSASEV